MALILAVYQNGVKISRFKSLLQISKPIIGENNSVNFVIANCMQRTVNENSRPFLFSLRKFQA